MHSLYIDPRWVDADNAHLSFKDDKGMWYRMEFGGPAEIKTWLSAMYKVLHQHTDAVERAEFLHKVLQGGNTNDTV
jgi:hypothetical protein